MPRHPAQDEVKSVIEQILSRGRRRLSEWQLQVLDFDFHTSKYSIRLTLDGQSAVAKIPSEWFDQVWQGDGHSRRQIKHALRDAVEPFYKLEDEPS